MEDLLSNLQNEPLVLIIVAIFAVAIAFLFMIPVFLKYLKLFGLPTIKASDEAKEADEPEEEEDESKKAEKSVTSEVKKATKKFPKLNFKLDFKKKSPKTIVLAVITLLVVVGVGYVAYDFYFRPVRVVSAWQFNLERSGAIKKLQDEGLVAWPKAKIYLLDLRSRESYAKDHLVGSESLPADRAVTEFYPIENVTMIIYSSNFNEARKVAEGIVKNGQSGKINYENPGQVIIIKDGFEGLKGAGLKTESGIWD